VSSVGWTARRHLARLAADGVPMSPSVALRTVKLVHTLAWAFFAGCILMLPVLAWSGDLYRASLVIGAICVEVLVLAANRMRCPLTDIAARYTEDRRDNFDIYLPLWLARHNKLIFGWLFVGGLLMTVLRWRG
jgi:hypothetical protein